MVLAQAGVAARLTAWYLECSLTTLRRWSPVSEETAQLLDRSRSGRPPMFSEATCLRVIAFYCQCPLSGCRGWSLSWAAQHLSQKLEIIGHTISSSTIHRILRKHGLRPHLVRYFLHITDPNFFPKMERLIDLYLHPPQHLFCIDECTGIQALERIAVRMDTDHGTKIEFEYKRHGTRDLFSIFDVRTGKVFGRVTDNHRHETFVEVLTEHVSQQPADAVLHYICDNLAGHSTEWVCRKVAELSGVPCPSLKTAPERRLWLQSNEKRIVFHFTPYHGSWLNQVELWFGIVAAKCLKGRSFRSVDELIETLLAFHYTWNEHFAHPFNWTYTGDGLHEKVVRRVTDWLVLKARKMDSKFLHKQLQLLINLVRNYWPAVPQKRWANLHQAILDSNEYLREIIDGHDDTLDDLAALTVSLSAYLAGNPNGTEDDAVTANEAYDQMPT
jgi:hypothetical protein